MAKQWAALSRQFGDEIARVPAHQVLLKLASDSEHDTPALAHLAAHLAVLIESEMHSMCEGKLGRVAAHFDAQYVSLLDSLDSENAMMHLLSRYVESTREATQGQHNIGLVSDVGHTGVKMDIGIVTMPHNLAFIPIPQALALLLAF